MLRILVVEDTSSLREMVVDTLREAGHAVVSARDGREAWELLDLGVKFNLVISDNSMPGMTGVELLRRIRADARTADTLFILMSGGPVVSRHDQTPISEFCAQHSATFLGKPFGCGLLEAMIDAVVARRP